MERSIRALKKHFQNFIYLTHEKISFMKHYHCCKLFFLYFFLIVLHSSVQAQTLKPGDISPTAKYIDADELRAYNKGAALITKGTSKALIDKDGNFIVPYSNNYAIEGEYAGASNKNDFQSGLFLINNPAGAMLTSKGVVIKRFILTPDRKYLWTASNRGTLVVDSTGKEEVIPSLFDVDLGLYSYGLAPFRLKSSSNGYGIFGYKNIHGKIIVPAQYNIADQFFDGMAVVGAVDQYGELKYGYIDTTGKLAIPLMFSVKPDPFYSETAIVYSKMGADFDYALINKKGETIQKYTLRQANFKLPAVTNFHGMRLNRSGKLLVYSGKIIDGTDFLSIAGIKPVSPGEFDKLLSFDYGDGKIYYKRIFDSRKSTEGTVVGILDINTGKKIEGPFQTEDRISSGPSPDLCFDKVSKLAYAVAIIKNKSGQSLVREGYINEDGIFVILKKGQSQF